MKISTFALGLLTVALCAPACIGNKKKSSSEKATSDVASYMLAEAPSGISKLNVNFDNQATLLGYKLKSGKPKPGSTVTYTLYWRAEKSIDSGWRLFTHVLNDKKKKLLNIDAVGPLREYKKGAQAAPPSSWKPGKVYIDEQTFTIPKSYKGDRLTVITGIWKGDRRLPVVGGKKGNRAEVLTLRLHDGKDRRSTRVPNLNVPRLAKGQAIKIDGKLDDAAWAAAGDTGAFVNVSTGRKDEKSKVQGSAKLLWDDEALFVAFTVADEDVVGGFKATEKDPHLWTKDTVELMLDPDGDGDNKDYYEIQVNPQNLVFDSQFDTYNAPKVEPNGPFGHQEWSSQIQSAVVIDGTLDKSDDKDKGYTVELRLPWKALTKAKHAPPLPGDKWRVNLYAMQNNGGVAWSPILGQGNFHKAARFGRLRFAPDKLDKATLMEAANDKVEAAKAAAAKDVKTLGLKPKVPAASSAKPAMQMAKPPAPSAPKPAAPKPTAPAPTAP